MKRLSEYIHFSEKILILFYSQFHITSVKKLFMCAPPSYAPGGRNDGGGVEMIIILIKNLLMENHVFVLRMVDPILEQNYD